MKIPPIEYCPECHSLKRKPNKECENHEKYWSDPFIHECNKENGCDVCLKIEGYMTAIDKLIPYWKQHPERWNIPCPHCEVKTASQGGLKTHIKRIHTPKYTVWACPRVGCSTTIYTASQQDIIDHNKVIHSPDSKVTRGAMKYATKEQNKTMKVANAITEIAKSMVKEIANMYIDVEDTGAGRSAQRFWYEQAEKLIRQYIRMLKLTYKTSTMTKSSKQK